MTSEDPRKEQSVTTEAAAVSSKENTDISVIHPVQKVMDQVITNPAMIHLTVITK